MTEPINDNIALSKTQIKKNMIALQEKGLRLTALAADTLKQAPLPATLVAACLDYKKLSRGGAQKRQGQYIGRLMRERSSEELQQIDDYLAKIDGSNNAHHAAMQRLERWRSRLIDSDAALTEYLDQFPASDTVTLRQLVRQARQEQQATAGNPAGKAYRALFQWLRQHQSATDA